MNAIPETVQIGPYTYRVKQFDQNSPDRERGDAWIKPEALEIRIGDYLHPQRAATGLLILVSSAIMYQMGVDEHESLGREFGMNFAATWGASPQLVAWIEGNLLEGRPEWAPVADWTELEGIDEQAYPDEPEYPDEPVYPINEEPARCTIIGNQNDPAEPLSPAIAICDGIDYVHYPTEPEDIYWSGLGEECRAIFADGGIVRMEPTGRIAKFRPKAPNIVGKPVVGRDGRLYQTIWDKESPEPLRKIPYGWHIPEEQEEAAD